MGIIRRFIQKLVYLFFGLESNMPRYWRKGMDLRTSVGREELENFLPNLWPKKVNVPLIRFGGDGDGGYVVPDDLDDVMGVFSPGVSDLVDFELDCGKRGMKLFLADGSIENYPSALVPYQPEFLAKNISAFSAQNVISMQQWVSERLEIKGDYILQMDIEGCEYESLLNLSDDQLGRFRIILVEFHELQNLWEPQFLRIAKIVFEKILSQFVCVHLHGNNFCGLYPREGIEIPRMAEFTFIRKDRVQIIGEVQRLPSKLDQKNVDWMEDIQLQNWSCFN